MPAGIGRFPPAREWGERGEGGNLPVAGAGRAMPAGIGRFPPAREWGKIFCYFFCFLPLLTHFHTSLCRVRMRARTQKLNYFPFPPPLPFPRRRESPFSGGRTGNARPAPIYCWCGAGVARWYREIPAFAGMERGAGMGGKGGGNGGKGAKAGISLFRGRGEQRSHCSDFAGMEGGRGAFVFLVQS